MGITTTDASLQERLATERNVWLASHRDGHPPHLVPIWFVWVDERFWLCTSESVKSHNVESDPRVTVALEDGNRPAVAEGEVTVHSRPYPEHVRLAFGEKYQWDVDRADDDSPFDVLLEVTPTRWVFGGTEG